jgi:hypothetical protein
MLTKSVPYLTYVSVSVLYALLYYIKQYSVGQKNQRCFKH